ncbi:MAG: hypothetical protein OXR67_05055 [Chloroflexota bacterium]|nr:hypothetical protein [Chloroflexota bacterium]
MSTSLGWDITTIFVVGLIMPPYSLCTVLMLLTLPYTDRRRHRASGAPGNDERTGQYPLH